ncbi:hypothetical protein FGRMN_8440 [Fusarium graminum]|nr:hypothetical protein FGRMN_8440 [Fusarium graminum]
MLTWKLVSGNGLGRDTWTITPSQLTTYLQYLYVGQTIYATEVFVTKVCVALFYLRIFPSVGVQRLLWGTIAFSVLCTIVFDILAIAQCRPISFFWQGWDNLHEGKCLGVNPLGWAIAAVSIIMDFWMLAIPLLQLFKLQMKWQRKVAVALMFLVGTFVTVVSVIRLRYLITFGNSSNPTWDSFEAIYWTSIETNVGIWCVCMPDLRILIRKVFPKIRTSQGSSSNTTPYGSGPSLRQRGKSANVSVHAHETYKGKAIQGYQAEHSSSTAELVELTQFGKESPNLV